MIELDLVLVCSVHPDEPLLLALKPNGTCAVDPCLYCVGQEYSEPIVQSSRNQAEPITDLNNGSITLQQFYTDNDHETWQGTITAYRNGVRYRLLNIDPARFGYRFRSDFREAWQRGWNDMDRFLAQGGKISDREIKMRIGGIMRSFILNTDAPGPRKYIKSSPYWSEAVPSDSAKQEQSES